jgi:hypothetical protein
MEIGHHSAGWYRWEDLDRRWGEARRSEASEGVAEERRSGGDRRRRWRARGRMRGGGPGGGGGTRRKPQPGHWLERVGELFAHGALVEPDVPDTLVTVHRADGEVHYTAWEPVPTGPLAHATYQSFAGRAYRQIGSDQGSVSDDESAPAFRQAYAAIYREYPTLRALAREHRGMVSVSI